MPNNNLKSEEALDLLIKLINDSNFKIEVIDNLTPTEKRLIYQKLRDIIDSEFTEYLETIKYAGKEELDRLEQELIETKQEYKLRIFKIIRAIYYC